MNEIFQAIILGLIQGITEFLPISSSAHLNLFPWIFNWNVSESFDVALHFGTLLAIGIYFFKDWIKLIKNGFIVAKSWIEDKIIKKSNEKKLEYSNEVAKDGKMFWYIVLATIPAGIISLILKKILENIIGDNLNFEMSLIAISLIVMGIILYLVDKNSESKTSVEDISLKQSLAIGTSQALAAAFPGVSRSGITMTVARGLKVTREGAAKFSFLLMAPIVAAAVLVNIMNFDFSSVAFWIGIITSFISGLLVIKFFMQYLKNGSFKGFAIYRIILGILVLGIVFFR